MKKIIISIFISISIFLAGAFTENLLVKKSFSNFEDHLKILYHKTELQSATADDAYATQAFWHNYKRKLHSIIPHVEIKEIDLWLSEAVRLIDQQKFFDAQQKIEVLLELTEQIPKSYLLKFENIF